MKAHVGCLIFTAITGLMLLAVNCFFHSILEAIEHYKMAEMLSLKRDSFSFPFWKKPPVPVYFELYVFHITNPSEVRQGAAPSILERGPYTYRVDLEKVNVTFNVNYTVTYRQVQMFIYERNLSVGDENDTFTTVNAPLFTVGTLLRFEEPWLQTAVNMLLDELNELPLITISVHDVFWGYDDRFLRLVKDVLDRLHIHSRIITGRFGYYMDRNNTDDGQYTVHTGTADLSKFLIIDTWNGKRSVGFWSTPWADLINGTDGSLYPPFVTRSTTLRMYDSNIYRSMSMMYEKSSQVHNIRTMRFVVDENEFANASVNADNAGFCTPYGNCIPSGVLNCSAMGNGAPIYVSLPHFLGADSYYFSRVHGLRPNKQQHQPYFNIHPLTGVCLAAARKYQLNVQIKEYSFLSKTRGLNLAYIPILWINGVAEIDQSTTSLFMDQIESPLAIVMSFHYMAFAVGTAVLILSLIVIILKTYATT